MEKWFVITKAPFPGCTLSKDSSHPPCKDCVIGNLVKKDSHYTNPYTMISSLYPYGFFACSRLTEKCLKPISKETAEKLIMTFLL